MIDGKKCAIKYGFDARTLAWQSKNMIMWDVPANINSAMPTLPNRIYCNRDMVAPLEHAFRNLIANGVANELKTWDGCFNPRAMSGYEEKFKVAMARKDYDTAAKYVSLHWFAVAVDLNAAWNQLKQKPTLSALFVKSFTDAGFDWGGKFTRLDGMHFQLSTI